MNSKVNLKDLYVNPTVLKNLGMSRSLGLSQTETLNKKSVKIRNKKTTRNESISKLAWFTKTLNKEHRKKGEPRLPAVIGGSYAYIVLILCIIGDSSLQRITEPHEAWGMNYLRHCNPPIVHCDLSSNLLVNKNWTVKVSNIFLPFCYKVKNTTELEQLEKIPKFKARPLNEKVTKPQEFHFSIDEWIPPCKNSF
ncbi:hypothetical protein C5167_020751 [Papaver somniferum]|uniref:Protein kinase domain-containing protein n=1 Tax=Papaver somniferum TaxID=3469 RepID=A0A4Y7IX39_PAPSO|nr:hypothetical protein C5167_020751 [Papaver somniferum]